MEGSTEPLPDLGTLSDDDLKALIDKLTHEENDVSFRRRLLQGRIDILRAERTARLKGKGVTDVDVEKGPTSSRRAARPPPKRAFGVTFTVRMRVSEPGESRISAPLRRELNKSESGEQTMTYTPEEDADDRAMGCRIFAARGPALVVRSGGGRAGESFFPSAERTLIGRSPECDVFLDDVTCLAVTPSSCKRARDLHDHRPRQPQRHVRQPQTDRVGRDGRRR